MDMPEFSGDGENPSTPTRKEIQLQGARPPPLRVSNPSHKIRKPPPHPKPPHPLAHSSSQPSTSAATGDRQPVIIYAVSPKVIHADASNFMSIVQRLTGFSSSSTSASTSDDGAGGLMSPAARLASIERTSPSERNKERERSSVNVSAELMDIVDGFDHAGGQIQGILSPAPANLPVISPGLFSPAPDWQTLFGVHGPMSPFMLGNSFFPSPTGLSSAPVVSPAPSPAVDVLFNSLFDL